ncbi:MAG: ATP-binding protein [Oligoflexia bacterium]|nr:ATP-binding protein [Oligoflexia bacterium]
MLKIKKYSRIIDLSLALKKSSQFLFGARGTGKSFLIRENLNSSKYLLIDLLKTSLYLRLAENPSLLEDIIVESKKKSIIIDEIQKLPILLDEVHRLIEEKGYHFLLTGSSARKLKRGKANMLAGRARKLTLHPLNFKELNDDFNLHEYLLWGGLPQIYQIEDRKEFLESYIQIYIKEEILAEQLARQLPPFSRFLKVSALSSGELINFTQVASDAQLPSSTVKNYFEVLEDTMIGNLIEPWTESKKRKAIQTGKFYFFDIGVRNRLLDINEIPEKSDLFGKAFEHFIFMELKSYINYNSPSTTLNFWRSVNHQEVDFILGNLMAIEVKSKNKVSEREALHLQALKEEKKHKYFIVVSQDPINREKNGILYLHWKKFLNRLWNKVF